MRIGSYGHTRDNPNRGKAPWVIYHNPRCSKSCQALDLLRANQIEPNIIEYLVTPLRKRDLEELLTSLKLEAKEIVRTKESGFAKLGIDLENKDQVLNTIIDHPEFLERPIIVHGGKAVIGRPPEKVLTLLD